MSSTRDCLVSVVAHVHNNEAIVGEFIDEVVAILAARYSHYELVIVDDHSYDNTRARCLAALEKHRCVRYLRLSRWQGAEVCITAGLENTIGDWVVVMSVEHDPPSEIPRIVELAQQGFDVVTGIDASPERRGPVYTLLRRAFLWANERLTHVRVEPDATDFRVFNRQAVNAVTKIRQKRRYFSVLLSDIGYNYASFSYRQIARGGSVQRKSVLSAVRRGASLIIMNSSLPLRAVGMLGLFGGFFSILYALYVFVINLMKETREGWTTLSLQIALLTFVVSTFLAILSEYVIRILDESTDRPLYHLMEERSSSVMVADPNRTNVVQRST